MALTDKDIIITPNRGQTAEPKIDFRGASASLGPQTITLNVYPTDNGTLSFEGSAGQLFSITNSLSGTIFSVNDVSGIPSIEVLDTGTIRLAQYSGNVGIGTSSPAYKLDVNGSTRATGLTLTSSAILAGASQTTVDLLVGTASRILAWGPNASTAGKLYLGTISSDASVGSTSAVVLDGSGNLGLGVTPQTWGSNYKVIEMAGASSGVVSAYVNNLDFGTNFRNDNTNWLYTYTGQNATRYEMHNSGQHRWYTAPSGTAGNPITFTQAMTLDASGNLGVGTTSPQTKVQIASTSTNTLSLVNNSSNISRLVFSENSRPDYTYSYIEGDGRSTGYLAFRTNDNERIRIDSNGNVGIGTSSPQRTLDVRGYVSSSDGTTRTEIVNGGGVGYFGTSTNHPLAFQTNNSERMRIDSSGNVGIGVSPAQKLHVAGNIVATGDVTAYYSDERLKTFDGKIANALEKVNAISGYYFYENELAKSLGYDNPKRQVGVSAQEIKQVLPEAVVPAVISDEYLTVKYDRLIPLLIEAIKEQNNKIEYLENFIKEIANNK